MLPSPQLKDVTIKDYLVILKRRIWVILACFIFVVVWFTLQTYKKVPLYQATAKVLIERNQPYVSPVQQVYAPATWIDREYVQSQINILTSRSMAKKVVEKLIASGDTTWVGVKEPEIYFLQGASVSIAQGTQMINIGYVQTDPIKAAKFANALTNTYIQQDMEKRTEVSKSATGWLEKELISVKKKLEQSDDNLNQYMLKNTIVSVPDIEKRTQGGLDALKTEKTSIENELAELSKRYKSKHPKIVALNTRLESVNKGIDDETKKLLDLNEKMIQYNALKREVESDKSLYESLLKRTKETEVTKELETTNIRIIDLATVPKAPFTPNRKRDIQMGVMLGILVGVGLAFFLEYLDSTIKTAEDIELYVKLPFLGYVPTAKLEVKAQKDNKTVDLISNRLPSSRIAEAYRSIRTSIIFSSPEDRPLKTILITSTSPREGKTTVSINLGTVFANANEKTIIIEADMRRPRIAHSMDLENKEGLSSYLAGTASLDSAIMKTAIPNLDVMPSGPKPPNPAELLSSGKTRALLAELKAKYDRIIVDSPPVLTVADTAILANIVDGVIDVILASFLNIDIILRSRQRLYEAKAKIIGVILNNVNVKKEDSYYYYHYYYAEDSKKKT